jgi:hypothetical protein
VTLEYIKIRVRKIATLAASEESEAAHIEQDDLVGVVLRAIALGKANPQALAAEALKALEIEFPRYYA